MPDTGIVEPIAQVTGIGYFPGRKKSGQLLTGPNRHRPAPAQLAVVAAETGREIDAATPFGDPRHLPGPPDVSRKAFTGPVWRRSQQIA
jgi:hypothetical protein